MSGSFGERLSAAFERAGHLCVGIDPHPYLLERWGLSDSAAGVRDFGLRVVDAASARAGIVKPQVAFYERHGSAGFAALEDVLAAARSAGLLVIADAKRGDLGTSVEAYGQAWLTPGSPLEADALTVSAFQGVGSLEAPAALAIAGGKGLFVLTATSNPESVGIQTAVIARGEQAGRSVSASIVAEVNSWNRKPLGDIGVVIGATVALGDYGLSDSDLAATPILAPGFGHQGVGFDALHTVYGSAAHNVVVSSSRAILDAGPDGITDVIRAQTRQLAEVFSA
ncbi:orotidine-5'-phosphate decarboxylase [Glaciihabitans tibetensis]|uniref:Orotidine-5'-phosphate decarboxylase n=1 Tax=Glaciihabitans tibetensis TaxID=1266600 RepID=A0A2T0VJJ1_9MICO|nr:orotidine-5'-phosphate decarboxylase [Glaciihabitans tibetensis]PRY70382.1 orotidine-5'-phosphate decarboxylase [Glaciihabitans tibetensis]